MSDGEVTPDGTPAEGTTPEGTTTESQKVQPQIGPNEDEPKGTIEPTEKREVDSTVRKEKEDLFQTKYQKLLQDTRSQYGYAPGVDKPPVEKTPPKPEASNAPAIDGEYGFDLSTREGQEAYAKFLREQTVDGLKQYMSQSREEERTAVARDKAVALFNQFVENDLTSELEKSNPGQGSKMASKMVEQIKAKFNKMMNDPFEAVGFMMESIARDLQTTHSKTKTEKEAAKTIEKVETAKKIPEGQLGGSATPLEKHEQTLSDRVRSKIEQRGQHPSQKL